MRRLPTAESEIARRVDKPGAEGAKWMCSPPARTTDDQDALWRALDLGDLQLISREILGDAIQAAVEQELDRRK